MFDSLGGDVEIESAKRVMLYGWQQRLVQRHRWACCGQTGEWLSRRDACKQGREHLETEHPVVAERTQAPIF